MKRVFFFSLDTDLKSLIAIFSVLTMIYVHLYYNLFYILCANVAQNYIPPYISQTHVDYIEAFDYVRKSSAFFNATEIKTIMWRDTNCRYNRNCCISYRISQDESEERSVYAYKVRRGYTRVGGEPCLPEIVFIPAHKERYEMRGWRQPRRENLK